jgi:hypothetical protein
MINVVYCPYCHSSQRREIEEEILSGELGTREIAVRYRTSLRAVERHARHIDQWHQTETTNERSGEEGAKDTRDELLSLTDEAQCNHEIEEHTA